MRRPVPQAGTAALRLMIARVSLELALNKEFDYVVPADLAGRVEVGSRVQVPFGARVLPGVVTAVAEESAHARLKSIIKVIGNQALVTEKVMRLARWMGEYYCCAPETALKAVLPEAVRREDASWKERLVARLNPSGAGVALTKRQKEIVGILQERGAMPLAALVAQAGSTTATIRKLEDLGALELASEIAERDPHAHEQTVPSQPLALNPAQAAALARVVRAMENKSGGAFLLHGVTGSGKTEVYLQAITRALELGGGAIVLVPEIALTPQTVERFKARFSHGTMQTRVAVLHSHLSQGERHDEWHKIRQGRARIVIGARSAIFAPVEPLGLVIVDEEHEHTYKQEEMPRYHARDVAIMRGRMEQSVVLLGSATPSMESYANARQGRYELLEMPDRVDDRRLPRVRVVDMRQTARQDKAPPTFSPQLKEAILQRLERREQTILFLNRRGYSSSLQCPKCGFVAQCPHCSISLTYHRTEQKLACHVCGHAEKAPHVCPQPKCAHPGIRFAGTGTQRVEEILARLFPHARVRRMDADTMRRKDDYRTVLGEFRSGKTDILLGTQMIAKGLHFPNVTLVGIIYADLALYQPDFRAGERTFQLLTQVAGRAGRGDVEGEVFVQAFAPFHPAIQYARRHDFQGFYEQEMEMRAQLRYPPHGRLALITLKSRSDEKVKAAAANLRRQMDKPLAAQGGKTGGTTADLFEAEPAVKPGGSNKPGCDRPPADLLITGPAPAPLLKAESFYRHQILLRTRAMTALSRYLACLMAQWPVPPEVSVGVDIDPVDMS